MKEENNISTCDANGDKYALNKDFQKEIRNIKNKTMRNFKTDDEEILGNKLNYTYTGQKSNFRNVNINSDNDNLEKTITEIVNKTLDSKYNIPNTNKSNDGVINHYSNEIFTSKPKYQNTKNEIEQNVFNFELEHIKQEAITLKNDNIILREDINRLNEIGVSLENELNYTRKKK
jgi:hypothetical protein